MKKLFALGAVSLLAVGLASCGETPKTDDPLLNGEGKTIELEYSGTASDQDFNLG